VHTDDAKLPPILVVDDNHDNAEIIRQYLEIRGYPITVAHDGDEALAVYESVKPAVVLLDVMMPGRDGWEVCRIMKQHPVLGKSVRIIMVTALDAWTDKREALQRGADDYVEKPFDLPTLARTVQRTAAGVISTISAPCTPNWTARASTKPACPSHSSAGAWPCISM